MKEIQILLVEDNEGDIVLTQEAFREGRIRNNLIVARDGQQALTILQNDNTQPDLILLDVNLPKMNGLELLSVIKTDERLKMIPVIMLSTSEADHDIVTSYTNHANCFITKPVDFNRFIEVIRTIESFWITFVKLPAKSN